MSELPIPFVDAIDIPEPSRTVLRPGETLRDRDGRSRTLPRQFLRIDSWHIALETALTPHFRLSELIHVDLREATRAATFPRFVPSAVLLLATALELFRQEVGTFVFVAANGGYRSPAHTLSTHASRHCWGTAANIYRIGDSYLDSQTEIEKYAAVARRVIPGVWTRPFGENMGEADDHLHIDLGYTTYESTEITEDGATEL